MICAVDASRVRRCSSLSGTRAQLTAIKVALGRPEYPPFITSRRLRFKMRALRNTQLKSLQSLLLDQRRALAQSQSERQDGASRVEAALSNRESPVDASREDTSVREMELELAERGNLELATVNAALSRIDAGTYGICLDCGQPIAYARLLADPSAVSCIGCQTRTEAGG